MVAVEEHCLVFDFGEGGTLFFARQEQPYLCAQVGGDGNPMPTIAKSVMNPIDPANMGHEVEGETQLPGPGVGDGDTGQIRKYL